MILHTFIVEISSVIVTLFLAFIIMPLLLHPATRKETDVRWT